MAAALLNRTEERAVWDSARNAAKLNFRPKDYETLEIYEKDFRRNSRTKSRAPEEKAFQESSTGGGREAEQNLEQADYFNSTLPPSKSMLQENLQHQREQNDFEDEYRPLPSPTRSSLRSPNKDPTIRSKEGYRVTFADKNFSDLSSENDTPDKPLQNSSDINCTRKPHYSNADKSGESAVPRDCRSQNFRNNCLTPTPVRSKATGDNERTKFSLVDGADRYTGDLKNLTKPSYADEPKFSSERLLRASTDDLQQKYEKLSLQVESLQQQLKQAHKLHETVNLLHDSQRSLVCTNEYLLQQLNKASPSYVLNTPFSSIKPRITSDKYLSSESSDQSASSPAHSSGQYRTPERLSMCPL
ncbi:hypothetical protein XENTR_v10011716 [Xenopus tropicalis]|nr:hypothetical protein XENTR_v10011716 [Xenopus tropicalis]